MLASSQKSVYIVDHSVNAVDYNSKLSAIRGERLTGGHNRCVTVLKVLRVVVNNVDPLYVPGPSDFTWSQFDFFFSFQLTFSCWFFHR